MLPAMLAALVLIPAVQALLAFKLADRLPAEAITGREHRDAILPAARKSVTDRYDAGLAVVGRYAQVG